VVADGSVESNDLVNMDGTRYSSRPVMQAKSRLLKKWLIRHRHTPYPSGGDKRRLAEQCKMTVTQVTFRNNHI
jgi:hypothetical protein